MPPGWKLNHTQCFIFAISMRSSVLKKTHMETPGFNNSQAGLLRYTPPGETKSLPITLLAKKKNPYLYPKG